MSEPIETRDYEFRSASRLYAFVRMQGQEDPLLHLVVRHVYSAQPWWLAIERLVFVLDGREHVLHTSGHGIRAIQSIGNARMTEWFSVAAGQAEKELIKSIIKARSALLRCESEAGSHDRQISSEEIRQLEEVVLSWQVLGGTW